MITQPKNSFTKIDRITKSLEYKANFKKARQIKGRNIKLYYAWDQERKIKVGIIISKKIKGAVKRNKYKRLIREYFRLNIKTMHTGKNVIILLMQHIQPVKYDIMANEIRELLEKAGILGSE